MTVFMNRSRFNAQETGNDSDIYIEFDSGGIDLLQMRRGEEGEKDEWDHIAIMRRHDAEQLIEKLRKLLDDDSFKFNVEPDDDTSGRDNRVPEGRTARSQTDGTDSTDATCSESYTPVD